ncbi:MAG: TonB-dependent receptor [Dysgonamonadaceae bacterium]|jgi:outer membrane receptor protein involved in Fe transport|nr:TonB-dependent receptor [Dysgonamonadaceae bacterium]
MKRITFLFLFFIFSAVTAVSQVVKGYVYDAKTEETVPGVSVFYKDKDTEKGTSTDEKGYYELNVPEGGTIINFSYLGYETQNQPLVISKNQHINLNIYLKVRIVMMDEVVVSVGRYEQKLSEITVSMEVLKTEDIHKQNVTDLGVVLNTLPGVDINDKQPSIRGGSGWTYGVGSRCLVLVDGMSVLTPAVGEINWNMIPMENVSQVEVVKGASSVLYGSSALNGIINVRTARPGMDPKTTVDIYLGVHTDPKNKGYTWWDKDFWHEGKFGVEPLFRKNVLSGIHNPIYSGLDISHTRRVGDWDVTGGLDLFADEGYRADNYNQRIRFGGNVTYHDPNHPGMNYGLNANVLSNKYSGFFIWRSADQPYVQSPLTNMGREGNAFYIDPFFNYYNNKNNTSHKIKGRYYYKSDQIFSNPTGKSITDILETMNFDLPEFVNSLPELIKTVQNPQGLVNNLMPYLLKNDIEGLTGYIKGYGDRFFPGATAPDYVDLLSWIMSHTPLPSDQSGILPWLNRIHDDKKKPAPADHTSSYYVDYQFNKRFENSLQFTTGVTFEHISNKSPVTGDHQSDNIGLFFQYDRKFFDKLNVSAGVRLEYYRVDSLYKESETNIFGVKMPFKPVFRVGLNYELADHSFIRASFGQGYRYPSLTEKFVYKDIGGIAAYPNKDLKPESGYNAELGIKQGYKFGNFMGFIDLAGFYTYYKDMIEFQFGLFNNSTYDYVDNLSDVIVMIMNNRTPGLGIRFANVNRAKIYGLDFSINGFCNISPETKLTYSLGYVYIEPIDAEWKEKAAHQTTNVLDMKDKSNDSKYLKYRQKHAFKGVFDLIWNRLDLGANLSYKTKTPAVDYFLVDERNKTQMDIMDAVRSLIFPGLHDYWTDKNTGHFTMDARLGVNISKNARVWVMVNNLLNTEYTVRPMDVSSPRTIVFQLNAQF